MLWGNSGVWSLLSMRSMVTVAVEQQSAGFPVSFATICRMEKGQSLSCIPKHEKETCPTPAQLSCTKEAAKAEPCSALALEPCRRAVCALCPGICREQGLSPWRGSPMGPTCTTMTWLIS